MKIAWRKITALALALVYVATNVVLNSFAESNIWAERSKAQQRSNAKQFAALPSFFLSEPTISTSLTQNQCTLSQLNSSIPKALESTLIPILRALPENVGTIRKVTAHTKDDRIVIHIQDVHRNSEAQENIGKAVQALIDRNVVTMIALEGAFTPIDFSWYRTYSNQDAVKAVADWLLQTNHISGSVYSAFTSKAAIPKFIGIDDKNHYDANVEAYRRSAPAVANLKKQVEQEAHRINEAKNKTFNAHLKDFDAHVSAYHAGSMSWGEYVRFLSRCTSNFSPNIAGFIAALDLEQKLNFSRVEEERTQLIAHLIEKLDKSQIDDLVAKSTAYRVGDINHSSFYTYLKRICTSNGILLSRYPSMDQYIRYVLLSDSLDVDTILKETSKAEKDLYNALSASDEEKRLVRESRVNSLTLKLLDFSLTKDEWDEYKEVSKSYVSSQSLQSFETFYREAEARDQAMAQNLENAMDASHSKAAVIVTGGFHSEGIVRRLQSKGFTVISYAPKITRIEDQNGSAYLSIFTQEKTPLDQLFSGEKLFLAGEQQIALAPTQALTRATDAAEHSLKRTATETSAHGNSIIVDVSPTGAIANVTEEERDTDAFDPSPSSLLYLFLNSRFIPGSIQTWAQQHSLLTKYIGMAGMLGEAYGLSWLIVHSTSQQLAFILIGIIALHQLLVYASAHKKPNFLPGFLKSLMGNIVVFGFYFLASPGVYTALGLGSLPFIVSYPRFFFADAVIVHFLSDLVRLRVPARSEWTGVLAAVATVYISDNLMISLMIGILVASGFHLNGQWLRQKRRMTILNLNIRPVLAVFLGVTFRGLILTVLDPYLGFPQQLEQVLIWAIAIGLGILAQAVLIEMLGRLNRAIRLRDEDSSRSQHTWGGVLRLVVLGSVFAAAPLVLTWLANPNRNYGPAIQRLHHAFSSAGWVNPRFAQTRVIGSTPVTIQFGPGFAANEAQKKANELWEQLESHSGLFNKTDQSVVITVLDHKGSVPPTEVLHLQMKKNGRVSLQKGTPISNPEDNLKTQGWLKAINQFVDFDLSGAVRTHPKLFGGQEFHLVIGRENSANRLFYEFQKQAWFDLPEARRASWEKEQDMTLVSYFKGAKPQQLFALASTLYGEDWDLFNLAVRDWQSRNFSAEVQFLPAVPYLTTSDAESLLVPAKPSQIKLPVFFAGVKAGDVDLRLPENKEKRNVELDAHDIRKSWRNKKIATAFQDPNATLEELVEAFKRYGPPSNLSASISGGNREELREILSALNSALDPSPLSDIPFIHISYDSSSHLFFRVQSYDFPVTPPVRKTLVDVFRGKLKQIADLRRDQQILQEELILHLESKFKSGHPTKNYEKTKTDLDEALQLNKKWYELIISVSDQQRPANQEEQKQIDQYQKEIHQKIENLYDLMETPSEDRKKFESGPKAPSSSPHHLWTLFFRPTILETYVSQTLALAEIPAVLFVLQNYGFAAGLTAAIALVAFHVVAALFSKDAQLRNSSSLKSLIQHSIFFIIPVLMPGSWAFVAGIVFMAFQAGLDRRFFLEERAILKLSKEINQLTPDQQKSIEVILAAMQLRDDKVMGLSLDIAHAIRPLGLTEKQAARFNTGLVLTLKKAFESPSKSFAELLNSAFNRIARAPVLLFVNANTTAEDIQQTFARVRAENKNWLNRIFATLSKRPSFICITIEPNVQKNSTDIIAELSRVQSAYPDVLSSTLHAGEGEFQERDYATMFGLFAKSSAFENRSGIADLLSALSMRKAVGTRIIQINKPTEEYTIDQVLLGLIVLVTDKVLIDFETVLLASKMA